MNREKRSIAFCDYATSMADGVEDLCKIIDDYADWKPVDAHRVNNGLQILVNLRHLMSEFTGHLTRIQSGDMTPDQARGLS